MISRSAFLPAAFVVAAAVLTAPVVAPAQLRPGDPTKGRVWIENRGRGEAIPVAIVDGDRQNPVAVIVTNVPAVTLSNDPPVPVRAGRQTWEYRTIVVPEGEDAATFLREAGSQGWEAVGVQSPAAKGVAILLKRPQ
jgi:hypothetical protein